MVSDRAIGRLTLAVWALVIVLLASLIFSIWSASRTFRVVDSLNTEQIDSMPSDFSASVAYNDLTKYNDFHEWPEEKRFAESSVVAIVTFDKSDSNYHRALISEILKMDENVSFDYEVGDELGESSYYPEENEHWGDGQIVYFVGEDPYLKMSQSIRGGRVRGLNNIKIETLREKYGE